VDVLLEGAKMHKQQQQQQQKAAKAAHTGSLPSDAAGTQPGRDDCKMAAQQQLQAPLSEEVLKLQLARGYCSLGKACLAEIDHPDRDCRNAAKALIRASQLDPSNEEMLDQLSHACEDLSSQQLDEVRRAAVLCCAVLCCAVLSSKPRLTATALRVSKARAGMPTHQPAHPTLTHRFCAHLPCKPSR
jgi:hypothetical protein